ncbi:MAG: hypothetical protein U0840_06855 [Gemmataceae bacterium]
MRLAILPQIISLLLVVAGLPGLTSRAAEPRDELFRFVPPDVGFCVVVQNLREHWAELSASPFAKRWSSLPIQKKLLASKEWKEALLAVDRVCRLIDVPLPKLRDELLGDCAAFAYRPGPTDRPDQEQGLFLLRVRDEKLLATVLEKLRELDRENPKIRHEARDHAKQKYFQRVEGESSTFYAVQGPILIFSGQEGFLKEAMTRSARNDAGASLARQFQAHQLESSFVGLLLNPRPWDQAVEQKSTEPSAGVSPRLWKAFQGAGLALHLDRDVRITLSIRATTEELPLPAQRLLTEAARPSAIWARAPDDALLVIASRFALAPLVETVLLAMPARTRQAARFELDHSVSAVLGKDLFKEVLPQVGPSWGLILTAPPSDARHLMPRATFALEVGKGNADDPIDEAMLNSLISATQLVVLLHNKNHRDKPIALRSRIQEGVRVRYLEGDKAFPPGIQPACLLRDGFLVLSTSSEGLRPGKPTNMTMIKPGPLPLLRVSFRSWAAYLKEHHDELASLLMGRDDMSREAMQQRLDDVRSLLDLFDRLVLTQETEKGQVLFQLQVLPAASLRR